MPRGFPLSGKRAPSAGRPPLGAAPLVYVPLRLSVEQIAWLATINPSPSAAVRLVLDLVREAQVSSP